MRFVGIGEVIEVVTIGVGETGLNVETFWMGGEGTLIVMIGFGETGLNVETFWIGFNSIRASAMRFRMRACTGETC